MKKIISLALITSLVFVMAACGSSGNTDKAAATTQPSTQPTSSAAVTPDTAKPAKLTYWISFTPSETDKKVYDAFKAKTGIEIEPVAIPYDQYHAKLLASVLSGTGPDLFNVGIDVFPTYPLKKLVAPMEQYMTHKPTEFLKAAIEDFSRDGHIYGLAGIGSIRMIYYNKTMFQKNSLPDPLELYAQGKWNWEAFLNAAKTLTKDTTGSGKIDQWGFADWSGPESFIWSNGGKVIDENNKYALNSPASTEAIQFYSDLTLKYHVLPKTSERTDEPFKMFAAGKAGMTNDGEWAVGTLIDLKMKDQWDVVPVPAGKGGSHGTEYFSGISVNAGSKNIPYAVQFAEFIMGPEGTSIAKAGSKFTAPQQKIVDDAMNNGVPPIYQGYPKLKEQFDKVVKASTDGTKNATQAAEEVKDTAQAAIDEVLSGK